MRQTERSRQLFARAQRLIPGGVNSPVRAFRAVGGEPFFVARGEGAYLWDVDGNRYLDLVCSWGPLILGHAHPAVVAAARRAVELGTSFGAPTEGESRLAEMLVEAMPGVEMVRLVNSGTEAVMSVLRLARAYTRRELVVKFEGGYHGHSDGLLSKAGSGLATLGVPDSPGVPAAAAEQTATLGYHDLEGVRRLFSERGDQVAAVILEPVAGNMGVIPPAPGFLEGLRELTRAAGALLIFDEVITGFRVGYSGAQGRFGVTPDLTTLGKIIGGGFPVGAYGGRREIMEMIAPSGPVYQAGTLSGNPVAVQAGIATLEQLRQPGFYDRLESRAARLERGLMDAAGRAGCPLTVNRVGSMLTAFFTEGPVTDYASARQSEVSRYAAFFGRMLDGGVYLAPSQFEAAFLSAAHTEEHVEQIIAAAERSLAG